jgi:glycosyltransferase involved in cell wall biosynthesis/SAM-dependent methyltransferase
MQKTMVNRAFEAFKQGDYLVALDFYRRLSERLGEQNFRANIRLCEIRLRAYGRRDCTESRLKSIKVACVMDEFTFHSYEPECELFQLTPDNAVSELETLAPDLLFIESAWRGKDELWNRKIGTLSRELREVLQWCKERQVPTVFWNKEDPIHFETFLTTAQQFDFIFTTDIDCIARYKAALRHERVYLLPFACQPKAQNPIEQYPRKDALCFAGAYYVRYPERTRDLENYVAEFPKFKPLEIFDRNFGKDDVNYMFPPEYQPYIVGTLPFNEIDKAYKGYRYSINLNSIKQSQSMFARRVYELLGSNTITVSNFSRGVRLMFGDLVVASDNGKEIVERLQKLDEESSQKFRLAGLRKVMLEHCYAHRFAYVARKALGWRGDNTLPAMLVIALVSSAEEYRRILESYQAQRHAGKRLLIVLSETIAVASLAADQSITVVDSIAATNTTIGDHIREGEWLAMMSPDDYYGPNYLLDLAIATRYCDLAVVGKGARYQWNGEGFHLFAGNQAYRPVDSVPARACAILGSTLDSGQALLPWFDQKLSQDLDLPALAIDPFNYCENGQKADDIYAVKAKVNDLELDCGIAIDELIQVAEEIPPAEFNESSLPNWNAQKLMQVFGPLKHREINFEVNQGSLTIQSNLPDGKHEYLYASQDLSLNQLPASKQFDIYLDATPGLDCQIVFVFLNDQKQKISHVIQAANRNHTAPVPEGTAFIRIGWRIYGNGTSSIKSLMWGHHKLEPARLVGRSDTLLLTNHYPSYDDLYRNGFVHSRVKAYMDRGVRVDVFRLRPNGLVGYHEYQNVDVLTGSQEALAKMLDSGRYKSVLVHFLSPEMWAVLERYPNIRKTVWVHGAEIQPWYRRDYNNQNDQERAKSKKASQKRIEFWRGILNPMARNLKLVFVSRYFAKEVFEDLGLYLPDDAYSIIHNPIDTELFSYEEKTSEQRKRVLSIRPYTSRTYANDLSVKAILELSKKPHFDDMEFRFIGDGKLFDETLEPLRKFQNVTIERGFLTHAQIAKLHKEYGIFLVPSRMDSQGVSRDEAMASGLVPVTNAVSAIPEFVDESSGILVPSEDATALADGINRLYESPDLFNHLSKSAAERVTEQRSSSHIVDQELGLIRTVTHKISGERPISFLSFDVEALPGRAAQDPVDRLIWGKYNGNEYGIRRISSILKQYDIKGNFLVDFAACLLYGDKAVQEIIEFLLSQGHEVHVHLHSEWVIRKWGISNKEWEKGPVGMEMLDDALSYSLLQFAAFKYRTLVGQAPVVFRAGGYRFNAATIEAAQKLGFKACSNFNRDRHLHTWSTQDSRVVNNEPFRWKNGLIELPVDFSPEPLSHDWEIYQGSFGRVLSRKRLKTFNLTLHSWTLLTRENGEHFTGFSAVHEDRLHKICQHLRANTRPMGYAEFLSNNNEIPDETDCECTLKFSSNIGITKQCSICGATYGIPLSNDICPSCESRARHRQILDVLSKIGNPFDGRSVLACHANPVEMQAFLANAKRVVNFDVRPLGYADLQMDIQSMDKAEDGSFETFVAIHVLNHVTDDTKALKEIHRVLKPGGVALITIPCREDRPTELCQNISETYGQVALEQFGVGSYRRYGLRDAVDYFSQFFEVEFHRGKDDLTASYEFVFILKKLSEN